MFQRMNDTLKISGVIITFNEEDNIERCIKSLVPVVDEVVVVDSYSTDKTRQLAIELGARFIENDFKGHIEQKNFAVKQAKYDNILSLDADEELSKELVINILKIKSDHISNAYSMNRLTSYCGHWIKHAGWYPDRKIRLWNKNHGVWGGTNPHDSVKLNDDVKVERLKGDILHFSYTNISQHIQQIDKFTSIAAHQEFKKDKKANFFTQIVLYPFWLFIKNYFLKLGFLDGYYGFIVCINGAFYKYLKYVKLFHLNRGNGKI